MSAGDGPVFSTSWFLVGLGLMLVFVVAGVGGGVWGLEQILLHHQLQTKGEVTRGEVLGKEQLDSRSFPAAGHTAYEVTFAFEVEGERIQRTARIGQDLYSRLSRGQSLPVRYLPGSPERSLPAEVRLGGIYWLATAFGFAVAAGAAVVAVGMTLTRLRHPR
jgi:hypothetical protein